MHFDLIILIKRAIITYVYTRYRHVIDEPNFQLV